MRNSRSTTQTTARRWLSTLVLTALLFSLLSGTILAKTDGTVPAKNVHKNVAQEDATPILLGEYVQQVASKDDLFTFSVYLPEEGDYVISPDDAEAAKAFSASISDDQGQSVYDGALAMEAVTLAAGNYTIVVTALEDGNLSFFVLGNIGGMSSSERSPGKLYPGSIYYEADVSDTRYATLTIPDSSYPQEVLLYIEAGKDDTFYVSVDGDDYAYRDVNGDKSEMLRFYSEGGQFTITVTPSDRRSEFTAIVFLAGAPVKLELGGELDATLSADTDTQIFQMHIDDVYDDVQVTLTPAEGTTASLSIVVVDHYQNGTFYVSGDTQADDSIVASTDALLPGDYYVVVTSYDGVEANYLLSAEGTPGAPMVPLSIGEPAEGTLDDGGIQYYRLDGVAAGTFLRITLASDATDSDFDLNVGMAQPLEQWTSASTGANEEVILIAPNDGRYYVKVSSYSGDGDYTLDVEEITGVGLISTNKIVPETVVDDGYVVFGFEIEEPGQLLSVLLASDEASDLDLSVVHFGANGERIHDLTSAFVGSSEIVSQAAADPGIYEARVRAYGQGGSFALLVRVEDPASLLGGTSQSSQSEGEVLLTDDFSDPESGWAVDVENGGYVYADDAYQITVDPNQYQAVMQNDTAYSDISLEIEATQTAGDPEGYAGLVCRSSADSYLYLDVSPAGDYAIGQLIGDNSTILVDWTSDDAIDTTEGAVNTLRLDCIGTTITAYANGVLLNSATVEEGEGGFGFEAGNTKAATDPAIFIFDNLVVSQP